LAATLCDSAKINRQMGLLDIFKEKTPLDKIKSTFRFLINDYGFKLIKTENREDFKARYFLIYRNDDSKLQLEICGDTSWFHCEIRRLLNGQPAKYNDKDNCIGFESLAILESNNKYEHFDYYAGGTTGLEGVLVNTANLFKRHKVFLTTNTWIDVKKVEQLCDDEFQKKFGSRPDHNQPTFFGELKKQVTAILSENGYKLLIDSDELSPFDNSSMVSYLTLKKGSKQIKITQVDWRDEYYIYRIEVNNKKIFEIDIRNHDIDKAVDITLSKLKQQL
jgi:hypothetical protein